MIELNSRSPHDTRNIAAAVAGVARGGDLIVLAGGMGAGKTAFTQGFAAALGVEEPVTSPTYTLVHSYATRSLTLHHADLYRLEHTGEVDDLALDELLDERSVMLVEWGDAVDLGPNLRIELRPDAEDAERRELLITSDDRRWQPRWERLEGALREWSR
jgi:tRNA threonylcarbamoyladenosine biosynthesis protein TsaE